MKKIFLFFLSIFLSTVLLTGCSSEDGGSAGDGGSTKFTPQTQVYVNSQMLTNYSDFNFAKSSSYAGQSATAYYFIRIDGRIPGMGSCSPKLYFPRYTTNTNVGSVFADGNRGSIKLDYPYWNSLDYNTTHIGKYIYDTSGKKVLETLNEVPSFEDMIAANLDNSVDFSKIDKEGLKIIWYVTKFEYGNWHVDGVLTFESTDDITDVPGVDEDNRLENENNKPSLSEGGNIEVDIHQQEHNTWQEVKTSIHIRDLVESVTVEIPIGSQYIAEADDFALRTYDLELESKVYINGSEYILDSTNPVKITISHEADKVVITARCTDKAYLQALRKEYGDGVTIEVHTYQKDLTRAEAWAKIKQSKVTVLPSSYKGLIFKGATSAFFDN